MRWSSGLITERNMPTIFGSKTKLVSICLIVRCAFQGQGSAEGYCVEDIQRDMTHSWPLHPPGGGEVYSSKVKQHVSHHKQNRSDIQPRMTAPFTAPFKSMLEDDLKLSSDDDDVAMQSTSEANNSSRVKHTHKRVRHSSSSSSTSDSTSKSDSSSQRSHSPSPERHSEPGSPTTARPLSHNTEETEQPSSTEWQLDKWLQRVRRPRTSSDQEAGGQLLSVKEDSPSSSDLESSPSPAGCWERDCSPEQKENHSPSQSPVPSPGLEYCNVPSPQPIPSPVSSRAPSPNLSPSPQPSLYLCQSPSPVPSPKPPTQPKLISNSKSKPTIKSWATAELHTETSQRSSTRPRPTPKAGLRLSPSPTLSTKPKATAVPSAEPQRGKASFRQKERVVDGHSKVRAPERQGDRRTTSEEPLRRCCSRGSEGEEERKEEEHKRRRPRGSQSLAVQPKQRPHTNSQRHQQENFPSNSQRHQQENFPSNSQRHQQENFPTNSQRHQQENFPSNSQRHQQENFPSNSQRHQQENFPSNSQRDKKKKKKKRTEEFQPTARPSRSPTARPSRSPTARPSRSPTARPSRSPTARPSRSPTARPSRSPTARPSRSPTARPSRSPPARPSRSPSPALTPVIPPTDSSDSDTQPSPPPTIAKVPADSTSNQRPVPKQSQNGTGRAKGARPALVRPGRPGGEGRDREHQEEGGQKLYTLVPFGRNEQPLSTAHSRGLRALLVRIDLALLARVPTTTCLSRSSSSSLSSLSRKDRHRAAMRHLYPPEADAGDNRRKRKSENGVLHKATKKNQTRTDLHSAQAVPTNRPQVETYTELSLNGYQEDFLSTERRPLSPLSPLSDPCEPSKRSAVPPPTSRRRESSDMGNCDLGQERERDTPVQSAQAQVPVSHKQVVKESPGLPRVPQTMCKSWGNPLNQAVYQGAALPNHNVSHHAEYYMHEAKRMKHRADAMVDKFGKAVNYMDAALSFMECGKAMEEGPLETKSPYTMYAETVELIRYAMKLKGHSGPGARPEDKQLAVLCFRCLALLYWRMFRLKKDHAIKYSKALLDYFKTCTKPSQSSVPWNTVGKSTGTSSKSSSPSPLNSEGSQSGSSSSTFINIPQRIHQMAANHLNITNSVLFSYEYWEVAETLSKENKEFFSYLNNLMGPVTLHSSMAHIVQYTRQGLQWIRISANLS